MSEDTAGTAGAGPARAAGAAEAVVAAGLAVRAGAVLDALGGDAARARLPFDDEVRTSWHYTPRPRAGVPLGEMDRPAAKATRRLLAGLLAPGTHARVAAVAGLEDVLDELEGGRRGRHAGDYWLAVFGDPGGGRWGWRFEGHHVSVNVTVAGGAVSATPNFLGANPATVADATGRVVLRPLAAEEDLAADLLASLDPQQRARAIVAPTAPPDITTGERSRAAGGDLPPPAGVAGADLRPDQRARLRALAAAYPGRLVAGLAAGRLAALDAGLADLHFAWAGDPSTEPGRPHYYRLQAPGLLVELDNTQNDANHVHTVWRDPDGDFGAALPAGDVDGSPGRPLASAAWCTGPLADRAPCRCWPPPSWP